MTGEEKKKPLMRSLGEFFGHIAKGITTDPAEGEKPKQKQIVRQQIEEEDRGDMILRRTTIEEIEYKQGGAPASPLTECETTDPPDEDGHPIHDEADQPN